MFLILYVVRFKCSLLKAIISYCLCVELDVYRNVYNVYQKCVQLVLCIYRFFMVVLSDYVQYIGFGHKKTSS